MKKRIQLFLKLGVTAICLWLIFDHIEFSKVLGTTTKMAWPFFLVAVSLALCNRVLMGWRWYLLLRSRGLNTGFMEVVRIIFTSNFVGLMIPVSLGVDAIRVYQMQKIQKDLGNTAGTLVADRMVSILMLAVCALIGIALSWRLLPDQQGFFLQLALLCGVMLAAVYVITARWTYRLVEQVAEFFLGRLEKVAKSGSWLEKSLRALRKIWTKIQECHGAISELIQDPRSLLPVCGISFLVQLSRILQVHFLFRGLGAAPALTYEFAFVPFTVLASLLPVAPMGIGPKEGAFLYLFSQVGIAPEIAVATSLFTHVATLLSILPGAYFFLRARKQGKLSETPPVTPAPESKPDG